MPVQIDHKGVTVQIVPAPLVSISTQLLKNGAGEAFGVTYSITLTGTILDDKGSPFATQPDASNTLYPFADASYAPTMAGPYGAFPTSSLNPPVNSQQKIDKNKSLTAILSKQKSLRALFANDGQKLAITDPGGSDPAVSCYPRVLSVDFQEGIYVERADYTITLEADTLLAGDLVNNEGSLITREDGVHQGKTENELLVDMSGAFITDFSEDWSIEADESQGESVGLPRSYRISHNINATGKTHYGPDGKQKAWEQAKKFVQHRLGYNPSGNYPNIMGQIGNGTLNLVDTYRGFNHVRSENLSESAGSYSVSENWLIASGNAYENFNLSISSSTDSPFISVSIDGNIKGLSEYSPSGFGGNDLDKTYGRGVNGGRDPDTPPSGAYANALGKYHEISNNGQFGLTSDAYRRANNSVAVQLNSQPKSVSLGTNQYTGEVTYNLQFDNRPTNIIAGVLSETISVNDTYPGDIFAVIPVLGRVTGPILQYIGGRTEYKRDISISLLMDYTSVPYGTGRDPLLLKKPSVVEPTATQIGSLIKELSPAGEPGVRKYFVSPPSESWNPKEGSYSFNLSWTYEMDK
jgi:hypothetical protein